MSRLSVLLAAGTAAGLLAAPGGAALMFIAYPPTGTIPDMVDQAEGGAESCRIIGINPEPPFKPVYNPNCILPPLGSDGESLPPTSSPDAGQDSLESDGASEGSDPA